MTNVFAAKSGSLKIRFRIEQHECHSNNLGYVLCIINVYLCSANGLLCFAGSA